MVTEGMGEGNGKVSSELSDKAISEEWPGFIHNVKARLVFGKTNYGDSSFERPMLQLIDELQQEAEDLAGWGFIVWARLVKMRVDLEELTSVRRRTGDAPRVDVRMGWDGPGACSAVIGSAPVAQADGAPND